MFSNFSGSFTSRDGAPDPASLLEEVLPFLLGEKTVPTPPVPRASIPLRVTKNDETLTLQYLVAGKSPEEVKVSVEPSLVVVKFVTDEKKEEGEEEAESSKAPSQEKVLRDEVSSLLEGRAGVRVNLERIIGHRVNPKDVNASLQHGLLTITVPLKSQAQDTITIDLF